MRRKNIKKELKELAGSIGLAVVLLGMLAAATLYRLQPYF